MYQENIIDMLMRKMIHFNQNDPQRIHHLIKVHSFAQMIGRMEQLDGHSQFLTECAALVHDIGIRQKKSMGCPMGDYRSKKVLFMPAKCWESWDLRKQTSIESAI